MVVYLKSHRLHKVRPGFRSLFATWLTADWADRHS